jgi:predicted ATPase
MHALIGRNGVGKTTFLNSMVKAVSPHGQTDASFYLKAPVISRKKMDPANYFGSLISVAFSAFDPFDQPPPAEDKDGGFKYSYIGLTDHLKTREISTGKHLKTDEMLHEEFAESLVACFSENDRKTRWKQAIKTLEVDENFAEMRLLELAECSDFDLREAALHRIKKMSSGHSIVILSMTLLVARVDEKTLVLFDEPESHLQPPLLSALMRSLAQLLKARNALAIIATHSPVVLQEIPKSCVWKVFRSKLASEKMRPEIETFGENVGTLTRDVFRLDVAKSGFHMVLADLVKAGGSYEQILKKLGGSLGYEGRGILKAMVVNREERDHER